MALGPQGRLCSRSPGRSEGARSRRPWAAPCVPSAPGGRSRAKRPPPAACLELRRRTLQLTRRPAEPAGQTRPGLGLLPVAAAWLRFQPPSGIPRCQCPSAPRAPARSAPLGRAPRLCLVCLAWLRGPLCEYSKPPSRPRLRFFPELCFITPHPAPTFLETPPQRASLCRFSQTQLEGSPPTAAPCGLLCGTTAKQPPPPCRAVEGGTPGVPR